MVRCSQYTSLHSLRENTARQIFSFSFRAPHWLTRSFSPA